MFIAFFVIFLIMAMIIYFLVSHYRTYGRRVTISSPTFEVKVDDRDVLNYMLNKVRALNDADPNIVMSATVKPNTTYVVEITTNNPYPVYILGYMVKNYENKKVMNYDFRIN